MNKYNFLPISLIGLIIIIMCGCSKDFIDYAPQDVATTDMMFQTEDDFLLAITGVYVALRDVYRDMYIFSDLRGDDAWKEVIRGTASYYSDVFTLSPDENLLHETWKGYYQAIYRSNFILDKIDGVEVGNKEQIVNEVKFLRALSYFNLVRIFGDVPMIVNNITIEESYNFKRENIDLIYDEIIIPDLISAENLPVKYGNNDIGRPTSGAAKSLLGKVYLTIHEFEKAENKLFEVIRLNEYELLDNYLDLFDYTKDEHHKEYIFDIEYESGGLGMGSPWTDRFLPLSPELTAHLGQAGVGGEDFNPSNEIVKAFNDPNDIRFDITVDTLGGFYDDDGVFNKFIQAATYTKKYITPISISNDSPANWKVIRFADVILMYAEALNENGFEEVAMEYLNMIRERAGAFLYKGEFSSDEVRDLIYLERRLELSFEGHRWFDLVRTGKAYDMLKDKGMKEYMTVFPIPLTQIQVVNDDSVLWQNPGYN